MYHCENIDQLVAIQKMQKHSRQDYVVFLLRFKAAYISLNEFQMFKARILAWTDVNGGHVEPVLC